jgi:hypothetical protein
MAWFLIARSLICPTLICWRQWASRVCGLRPLFLDDPVYMDEQRIENGCYAVFYSSPSSGTLYPQGHTIVDEET